MVSRQLDHPTPYAYALLVSAALLVPAVIAVTATQELGGEPKERATRGAVTRPLGLIGTMSLVVFVQVASEGAVRYFFNVYLDAGLHIPTARIGTLAAGGQLVAVPAALLAPVVVARWGNGRTFLRSSLAMALATLLLALVPDWRAGGLGFMGVMAMSAVARPCIIVYQMEIVSPSWRPLMSGATTLAFGLSLMTTNLAGGYIIESAGYLTLFLATACLTAAGALLFRAYFGVPRGEYAQPAPSSGPFSSAGP